MLGASCHFSAGPWGPLARRGSAFPEGPDPARLLSVSGTCIFVLDSVSTLVASPRPRGHVLFAGRLVGWNASGEFAAAFPTVSLLGGVVTAWEGTTPFMVVGVWLGAG